MKKILLFICINLLMASSYCQIEYKSILSQINKDKKSLRINKVGVDSVRCYILNKYLNSILPSWVGTPWGYNGHTNTPKQSSIACGYFVTTSLLHMGFYWNRYKLAKLYSKKIVSSVCDSLYEFNSKVDLLTYVRYRPDNLYILGLSGHVGIVLKYKSEIYFIHSDYYNARGPVKETIMSSNAINDSDVFWCGTFLSKKTITMWLNNQKGIMKP